MTVLRVLASIVLLIVALLCRRRPLMLLLVGIGLRRLWHDAPDHRLLRTPGYRSTMASHRR